jgi:predicted nucleotidyltransferase
MALDKSQVNLIQDYFKTRPVLKAYLFGSTARGTNNHDSDIDILVDLDYSQKIGLAFFQMQTDLEELLNARVDLVSSQGISPYIKPFADQEKELIYAHSGI